MTDRNINIFKPDWLYKPHNEIHQGKQHLENDPFGSEKIPLHFDTWTISFCNEQIFFGEKQFILKQKL